MTENANATSQKSTACPPATTPVRLLFHDDNLYYYVSHNCNDGCPQSGIIVSDKPLSPLGCDKGGPVEGQLIDLSNTVVNSVYHFSAPCPFNGEGCHAAGWKDSPASRNVATHQSTTSFNHVVFVTDVWGHDSVRFAINASGCDNFPNTTNFALTYVHTSTTVNGHAVSMTFLLAHRCHSNEVADKTIKIDACYAPTLAATCDGKTNIYALDLARSETPIMGQRRVLVVVNN